MARMLMPGVSDPACGAAGMLIVYAECLLGIDAEVVTGNTLTMQFNRVRYTPVYYLNGFEKRLADLRRFRAMRDFMRGLSDAA